MNSIVDQSCSPPNQPISDLWIRLNKGGGFCLYLRQLSISTWRNRKSHIKRNGYYPFWEMTCNVTPAKYFLIHSQTGEMTMVFCGIVISNIICLLAVFIAINEKTQSNAECDNGKRDRYNSFIHQRIYSLVLMFCFMCFHCYNY